MSINVQLPRSRHLFGLSFPTEGFIRLVSLFISYFSFETQTRQSHSRGAIVVHDTSFLNSSLNRMLNWSHNLTVNRSQVIPAVFQFLGCIISLLPDYIYIYIYLSRSVNHFQCLEVPIESRTLSLENGIHYT